LQRVRNSAGRLVPVRGADQPAVRIALNPVALSNAGIATDAVRTAIINANPLGPVGIFNGDRQSETLSTNRQMRTATEFRDIIIKNSGGNFVRLSDVADVKDATRNSRSIAWFNKQPAVLIQVTKQGDANVIDTVDRVRALLPELKKWIPGGVEVSIIVDRTGTAHPSGPAGLSGATPLEVVDLNGPLSAWMSFPGRWSEGQLLWFGRTPTKLTSLYDGGGPATPNWNATTIPSGWHAATT